MFKVGDRVRRLNSECDPWWCSRCEKYNFSPFDTFIVKGVRDEGIAMFGEPELMYWQKHRFELVLPSRPFTAYKEWL